MDALAFFKWGGYAALALGTIFTILAGITQDKKDKYDDTQHRNEMQGIQQQLEKSNKLLEPFTDLAIRTFPGMPITQALENLTVRLDSMDREIKSGQIKTESVEKKVIAEKKTIKSMIAKIYVAITGEFPPNQIPFSIAKSYMGTAKLMKFIGGPATLEFETAGSTGEELGPNKAAFRCEMNIPSGNYPLGEQEEELKKYSTLFFQFSIDWAEHMTSSIITIDACNIELIINGISRGICRLPNPITIDIKDYSTATPWNNTPRIWIPVTIHENIPKLFDLKF